MKKNIFCTGLLLCLHSISPAETEGEVLSKAKPNSHLQLDSTTIFSSESDILKVSGSAHLINEETLSKFEYDDVHRILSEVPGVYVREEDGYGLRPNIGMRGGASDRSKKVTLMEDGVLFGPAPYSAPAAYFFPQMTRMTGIEVFKGPAAISYGPQTVGGAINVKTRDVPLESEGGLDLSLGSDDFRKGHIHYGNSSEHVGFLVEGLHLESSGFKDLTGGGDTGFDKNEIMGKLKFNSDPKKSTYHQVIIKAGYAEEISNETYLGLSSEDFSANPYQRYAASAKDLMDWDRTQFSTHYYFDNGKNFTLDATIYRHDYERSWRKADNFDDGTSPFDVLTNPSDYNDQYNTLRGDFDSIDGASSTQLNVQTNQRKYYSQGIQLLGHLDQSSAETRLWTFGLRFHQDEIKRNHTRKIYNLESGALVEPGSNDILATNNHHQSSATAAHISYEHQINKWMLMPGLRYEYIDSQAENAMTSARSEDHQQVLLPGFGATYEINPSLVWLGGVHLGFSPVSPGQNGEIEPEESWNYETGLRYVKDTTRAEAVAFFSDYSNILGDDNVSSGGESTGEQFNAGAAHIYGLELNAQHNWNFNRFSLPLKFTYTYTSATFEEDFVSKLKIWKTVSSGDNLPYIPQHQASLSLGYEKETWQINLLTKYVSEMLEQAGDFDNSALFKTDEVLVVDLSAQLALSDSSKTYLKVDNIFDQSYIVSRRPLGARPGKPLQAAIGYKLKF